MRRQNLLLLFLLLWFSHSLAFTQTAEDFQRAKEFYETGNLAIQRGDFPSAIDNYDKAIAQDPYVPEFYFNRSIAYRNLRKYDLAVNDLNRILDLNPNLPIPLWAQVYFARGTVLQEKGDYTESLDSLSKAISLDSNNANFYTNRANTYFFLKKYDPAIDDYAKSLELQPLPLTFYNRARLYAELGKFDRAIDDYTKAIELSPQFAEAFSNRGLVYQEKGRLDLALRDLTRAISLDNKDGTYYFNRANVYFQKGSYAASILDYTKATEIYPLWAAPLRRRSSAYRKLGQIKLAEEDLRRVTKVEKENFDPANRNEIINPKENSKLRN